jgi:streptogrisin C
MLAALPAQGSERTESLPAITSPPLAAAKVPGSVAYLTRTYHVSAKEALRRLELQSTAPAMADRLAAAFPGQYGGMWLDQDHGGVLRVAMTRPDLLGGEIRSWPQRAYLRPVKVRFPLAELRRTAAALPGPTVTVNVVRNRVETSTLTAVRSGARAAGPAPRLDPMGCQLSNCPPPIRGGIRLDLFQHQSDVSNPVESCSVGFNVAGSNGWEYTLTAGHCVQEFNRADGLYTRHNGIPVGYRADNLFWGTTINGGHFPTDYAIMPFDSGAWANYWLPPGQPKSMVDDLNNSAFVLRSGQGWACGSVTDKSAGGIFTNLCRDHGDSGGPLYSEIDRRAYGVLSGNRNNRCDTGYSPLSKIFSDAQSRVHITFNLLG